MEQLFSFFGIWTWWIIAAALLILELLVSGVFLVWLGIAAAGVAIMNLFIATSWQVQTVVFGVLSIVLLLIGRPLVVRRIHNTTDQPNLNRRMYSYVGNDYVLTRAIRNGNGKVKIDDNLWQVSGPDLPAGARVTVTGVDGMRLVVEAASGN